MLDKTNFHSGLEILATPVLPLVSMVQFLFLTGGFEKVEEVVCQLPEPIETGHAVYEKPQTLLQVYLPLLEQFSLAHGSGELPYTVVDEAGVEVDRMTAVSAMVGQAVLAKELEQINSRFCEPCGCTLCCTGPETSMLQHFFEIPLRKGEEQVFDTEQIDSENSRSHLAMGDGTLMVEGKPFYLREDPVLVHWQNGWSLMLPENTCCPRLVPSTGRCRIYPDRPDVCRRPQIFPYILEPLSGSDRLRPTYRLRHSLLAVMDCPYVQVLKEEIGDYGAACELEVVFKANKE